MLNQSQFKGYIEEIISINGFNLAEYQDKYYFQKKVSEKLPEFNENEIYTVIQKFFGENLISAKDSVTQVIDELFRMYSDKFK